jgi:hypothetical protein
MQDKYHFEIALPVDTDIRKIKKRIDDFKRHGLQNHENFRIKLFLLASTNNKREDSADGWPSNFDVTHINTPYHNVAQRIYHYYLDIIQPNKADWYLRIDEDSITDLEGLRENLQRGYDPEREYHITSKLNWDGSDIDEQILDNMGYDWWYINCHCRRGSVSPPHEQEVSVTSNKAIARVCESGVAREYLEKRIKISGGYGDHSLCHMLKMNKVHPHEAFFLTHEPQFFNQSIFGGVFNHVHWICHDRTPEAIKWLDELDRRPSPDIDNKLFVMGQRNKQRRIFWFNSKKGIQNYYPAYHRRKEGEVVGVWSMRNEELVVYTPNPEKKFAVFNKVEDGVWMTNQVYIERLD